MSTSSLFAKVTPARKGGVTPVPLSGLSIFTPVFLGIDETGCAVYVDLPYRNLLVAGQPGSGKSGLLNNIAAHVSLCADTRIIMIDGKQVELGMYEDISDVFVGPDYSTANDILLQLQCEMDRRYEWLKAQRPRRRKITAADGIEFVTVIIDEIAYYSATVGTKISQETFIATLRDLVARGRAAGIIVVAATQRPSADIVPTSLRDIFAYRCAFRCTTEASSDIILGTGWAKRGYDATTIASDTPGIGWLLSEESIPFRFRSAYLFDDEIEQIVAQGASIRAHLLAS